MCKIENFFSIFVVLFQFILKAWGDNLNGRSAEEKMSRKGRESSAIQSQTVAYMKPLFRNLKHKVSLMYNIIKCYDETELFQCTYQELYFVNIRILLVFLNK